MLDHRLNWKQIEHLVVRGVAIDEGDVSDGGPAVHV